jgi:hypothetical protein
VRGEVGSRSGPFIGAGRRFGEIFVSFAELQWLAMEVREKPGVDSDRRDSRSIGCCVS